MSKNTFFRVVYSYIKKHRKSLMMYSLYIITFAIILSLYNLPLEAVGYASLLCTCFAILYIVYDFINYYKKHMQINNLKNQITIEIPELPKPKDLIEKDYQEVIRILFQDKMQFESNTTNSIKELEDYYTLWLHQVKTPISAMRLLLQSEETELNSELLMELFKIEQYVEMVLQYIRIDSISTDFVFKKYNLDDIVRQAVRKYAKIFIKNRIILDYNELNCEVLTDERWLVFVIEQLLSNALKYTKHGKISIYMEEGIKKVSKTIDDTEESIANKSLNCTEKGQEYLKKCQNKKLIIEDTGIGIAAEDLPRVFEKGYTGYNGRFDKKSTGIGLYLCKSVLDKLSHRISIQSIVGKGTKVIVDLNTMDLKVE